MEALKRNAIDLFQRLVNLVQYLPDQLALAALNLEDPRQVVYLIASSVQMDLELRQELLELDSVREKLEKLTAFLTRELEVLELGKKIQSQAQEEMGKAQREYFLREQLKAIQKELGEESEEAADDQRAAREDRAGAACPTRRTRRPQRELSRLEKLPAASPEYSVIRTYLDLLVSLPWNKSTGKQHRRAACARGAGRGPLRPGEDQGPHPGIPGGAPPERDRAGRPQARRGGRR